MMKKSGIYRFFLEARGYELDSYQHVNNAVYLNYMEQARWDLFRQLELLDQLKAEGKKIVVAEVNTRYGRQVKIFDEIRVETQLEESGPFLLFSHKLFNNKTNQQVARAVAKTVFLDAGNNPCDIPGIIKNLLQEQDDKKGFKACARLSREGEIGLLELHNPPQNFLIHPEFIPIEELDALVQGGIKALVISGAGRHFSAGADLKLAAEQMKDKMLFKEQLSRGNHLLHYLESLTIPVVAALSGVCFGGGLEIALAAHIRISNPKTLFAFPEVNHNLMPGMGGLRMLRELIGQANALELTCTGDMIDAGKAREMGLIDLFCEKGKEKEFAVDYVQRLTNDRPVMVIQKIMTSLHNHKKMGLDEAIERDTEMFCELAVSEQKRREENNE